jgi:hypothetical protein
VLKPDTWVIITAHPYLKGRQARVVEQTSLRNHAVVKILLPGEVRERMIGAKNVRVMTPMELFTAEAHRES